jgi:hypothetical protein
LESTHWFFFFWTVCVKRRLYGSEGIQFDPNQPTLSRKITFFRSRPWERGLESTYWSYDISEYRGWYPRSVFVYKLSWRMGNTRAGSLWYYAICTTRCTYNMHGSSRFNGIFDPGRWRNYQTSSIPSRLAPMRLLFERKKKTMPSPYEIWILSNNSMALWIRYKKFCFQNIRLCIERVICEKGISDFIIGSPVQRHKLFFTPEVS